MIYILKVPLNHGIKGQEIQSELGQWFKGSSWVYFSKQARRDKKGKDKRESRGA